MVLQRRILNGARNYVQKHHPTAEVTVLKIYEVNWKDSREVIALAQQIDPAQGADLVVVRGESGYTITHAGNARDRDVVWPKPELNPALHV